MWCERARELAEAAAMVQTLAATLRLHPSHRSGRHMIALAEEADLELRFPSPIALARLREV